MNPRVARETSKMKKYILHTNQRVKQKWPGRKTIREKHSIGKVDFGGGGAKCVQIRKVIWTVVLLTLYLATEVDGQMYTRILVVK